jgi:hypothetical protein
MPAADFQEPKPRTTAPGEPTARASVCGCLRMYDRRCGPAGLLCPGALLAEPMNLINAETRLRG